jgi:hypothetical protein
MLLESGWGSAASSVAFMVLVFLFRFLELLVGQGMLNGVVTHLVFFALSFFVTFAIPPFPVPASSLSSAGTSFTFLTFLAVGFAALSSAFNGPHLQIFGAAGSTMVVVVSLAQRLGGIVCESVAVAVAGWYAVGMWVVGGRKRVTWQWMATGIQI